MPEHRPTLTDRLHHLLASVRLFDRRRPYVWDVTATLFWVASALTDYASSGWRSTAQNLDVPDILLVVLSLGFTLPLLWRRRHPMRVLLATAPFALLNSWSGAILQAHLLQLVPVFSLALHRPLKQLCPAFLVVVLPLVPGALRHPLAAWDAAMGPALWGFALTALFGIAVRSRRDHLASSRNGHGGWPWNATSRPSSPPPPNAPASPGRCTTSSATTCPSSRASPTAGNTRSARPGTRRPGPGRHRHRQPSGPRRPPPSPGRPP